MDITDVRVFPVNEEKLKAFVSIIFDGCFVVSDIKIISGTGGLFVSMPSKRRRDGTYRDVAHPLNSETRRWIEETILARYREALQGSGREQACGSDVGASSSGKTLDFGSSTGGSNPPAPASRGMEDEVEGRE